MSKKSLSELFKRWVNRGRRLPGNTPLHRYRTQLRLDEFEVRIVPATLPAISATDTRTVPIQANFNGTIGAFAPQAVADPNNPNTIVVIAAGDPITAQPFNARLLGNISLDGGKSWNPFNVSDPDTSFESGPGGVQLTNVNSPSVAFSRTGQLYVVWTSTTADFTTAGVLRVSSFQVGDSGTVAPLSSAILYQWLGQDPVYNPTVAVDNNVDQFTDPDTLVTSPQDTMLQASDGTEAGKAVYVAWNTNALRPQASAGHGNFGGSFFNPTAIFAAASRDQGASWSTPVQVSDNGFFGGFGGVDPQIVFTPRFATSGIPI
ncbi:MAG TPA: hypothetical protein VN641_02465, partial [Urbifossiella sp.]|nr:hypothetical protein [Urbifossiella sp.]